MPFTSSSTPPSHSDKAALRGEPSYVWREGQQRRLDMIVAAAGPRIKGRILENGCGVGMYVQHLAPLGGQVFGLEYEFERAAEAGRVHPLVVNAAGEHLPYPADRFDLILSHEVLEHVQDDRLAVAEMVRALKPGGRMVVFCPNRGYTLRGRTVFTGAASTASAISRWSTTCRAPNATNWRRTCGCIPGETWRNCSRGCR